MEQLNLDFIFHRRLELKISLQKMAESLGFKNASTYMKYERGEYAFKAYHLPTLAILLQCEIANFFEKGVAEIAK